MRRPASRCGTSRQEAAFMQTRWPFKLTASNASPLPQAIRSLCSGYKGVCVFSLPHLDCLHHTAQSMASCELAVAFWSVLCGFGLCDGTDALYPCRLRQAKIGLDLSSLWTYAALRPNTW